jgi:predicted GNAT family acetyltransferase
MGWRITGDLTEYLAAAGAFLRSRPAEHTLPLTVAETLRSAGGNAFGADPPLFGWWSADGDQDGTVAGAFVQTPPYPLLLTRAPEPAVPALAAELAERGGPLAGVSAAAGVAERFAAAWTRLTGAGSRVGMRQQLYRLDRLTPPRPAPPGAARAAGPADRDLLLRWYAEFLAELGELGENPGDFAALVDDRLAGRGGFLLWEADGVPVSMAGMSRLVAGMVRVTSVYTPPEHRRRGYAAGVTAAVSRAALDGGAAEVLLFTDLDNPTSNRVYRRLGYQAVEDRLVLSFTG